MLTRQQENARMPYLTRPGQPRLYYDVADYTDPWKNAPAILLQHGYARSSLFWNAWVPYLSRFYRVVRMDWRGLGRSGTDFDPRTGITFPAYLQDYRDLLDHLKIDSIHYCGESSAGTLGMIFAAECPERVRTLTVISSPVSMTEADKNSALPGFASRQEMLRKRGSRGWLEASNAGRRYPADADAAMLEWTVDEMAKSDVEVLIAMFELVSNADAAPYLTKIRAPTLAIYPRSGVITSNEHLELLRENVSNIQIVRIDTASHSVNFTSPATCAREVLHFISRHDGIPCHEA